MIRFIKFIPAVLGLLLLSLSLQAEVRLPQLISDGMVLQRDAPLKIWGWANPDEAVSLQFAGKTYRATAGADGGWQIMLPPQPAGGPYSMTIEGKNTIELSDILFGDVWLCSGQSNMELSMGNVAGRYPDEIANADNNFIRQFAVPKRFFFDRGRLDLSGGTWKSADPETVKQFSAVAYFFALDLYERYQVPIGLINASLGGSPAEAWMSEDALKPFPSLHREAVLYQDKDYVTKIQNDDNTRIKTWYGQLAAADPGYQDPQGKWSEENFADDNWDETTVPGFWTDGPLGEVNGSVWYRRKFTLPAGLAGKAARLPFGNIIDADSVFINGQFIGAMGSRYVPRNYAVPEGVLKGGENTIAVRVVSSAGKGGFIPEKQFALVADDQTIDLTGTWKIRGGGVMEPLAGPTFIMWKPAGLYNGMINPLLPLNLKGVIWYQGESNVSRSGEYRTLFPAMIQNWREKWQQPDLPFLFVQLPGFGELRDEPAESGWAEMREAQAMALELPHTGMAVAIDLGEWNDIHPLNKQDVGLRLSLQAQQQVYGDQEIVASGPVFRSMEIKGQRVVLHFDHPGGGLKSSDGQLLRNFAIAGPDMEFVWAKAEIDGDDVVVWHDDITAPAAVRYAWADAPQDINFINAAGLPARPFRTDLDVNAGGIPTVSSPDGKIVVTCDVDQLQYAIQVNGETVLQNSRLGLIREDADFSKNLKLISVSEPKMVLEHYQTLNAKKRDIDYLAMERTWRTETAAGEPMDIVFRVSNDGVAFRYVFPDSSATTKFIREEMTSFHFPEDTRAWLQPKAEAQTGFEHTNPSYEVHYEMDIPVGTPAPGANGWVYPALFRHNDTWLMITEADLGRTYCGTALRQHSPDGEYTINFPQAPEVFTNGKATLNPESVLPWKTPWRIIATGSLQTVAESTLGTDLASPAIAMDSSFIKPGKASWSWVLDKDDATIFSVQKKYIDYAKDMNWQYCLIDANWDQTIGYDSVQILADYAKTQGVGILLWYNSAGSWNTVPFTPKDKLLTHEDRMKEFGRLHKMGIKGIKIDFFAGDGQSMIAYYQDILEDAAANQLLVNFHGATLPRGLQRTYPNFMTAEAVHGYEMITFSQGTADRAPSHMAMCALVRNAFDPMDFTPMNLYKIPRIERATTAAFELATSVTFLSGIQHYAERPQGMEQVPEYVREFLRELPVSWEETRFITGYPGELFVVARRAAGKWYVAGINGEDQHKELELDLDFLRGRAGELIFSDQASDTDKPPFSRQSVVIPPTGKLKLSLQGNDGFVLVIE